MKLLLTLLNIAVAYAIIFGMTAYIDVMVQISNAMYSSGHNLGTFLKDFFD